MVSNPEFRDEDKHSVAEESGKFVACRWEAEGGGGDVQAGPTALERKCDFLSSLLDCVARNNQLF